MNILKLELRILNKEYLKNSIHLVLFLAVLGLCCCTGFSFSLFAEIRGYSLAVMCGPLTVVSLVAEQKDVQASVVAAPGLGSTRLSSYGAWSLLLCGMCNVPRSGIEPVSFALSSGFFTTEPPGKLPEVTFSPPRKKKKTSFIRNC